MRSVVAANNDFQASIESRRRARQDRDRMAIVQRQYRCVCICLRARYSSTNSHRRGDVPGHADQEAVHRRVWLRAWLDDPSLALSLSRYPMVKHAARGHEPTTMRSVHQGRRYLISAGGLTSPTLSPLLVLICPYAPWRTSKGVGAKDMLLQQTVRDTGRRPLLETRCESGENVER